MENKSEEIEISGKTIIYGIVIALILLLALVALGVVKINLGEINGLGNNESAH